MTTKQIVEWFYSQEETPEPSELEAMINRHDAVSCAIEVKRQIDMRFKNRSTFGTGKKVWEQNLLWKANEALGVPQGDRTKRVMWQ